MKQKDEETLNYLIQGGLLGLNLTSLLNRREDEEDMAVGVVLEVALVAAFGASEKAKKTMIPLLIQIGDSLYFRYPDGHDEFFKKLPENSYKLESKFKLS
jgi:hypothetical protein